jgi:hypothetical protein
MDIFGTRNLTSERGLLDNFDHTKTFALESF